MLLAAVAFGFAQMAGGPLPWYLFYTSFGLVVVAGLWAWQISRTLQCTVSLDRYHLYVGETLRVRLRVETEGLLPLPWIEVNESTPGHLVACDSPQQATSAGGLGSRILTFHLQTRRRGHFRVGPLTTTTGDGFGLFSVTRSVSSHQHVTVYPRIIPLEEMPIPLGQPFGHVRTRQKAFMDPFSLSGIRPYRPGDSLRHIHWAVSARRGELHLKEFELNATTDLAIVLDLEAAAHVASPAGDTAETAVELAASLAHLAARRNFALSVLAVGRQRYHVPLTRGLRAFNRALEVLARVETDGEATLAQVLQTAAASLPPRATLALITPRLDSALAQMVLQLRRSHPLLLVVLRRETYWNGEKAANPREVAEREQLLARLASARVPVYAVASQGDIAQLAAMRVQAKGMHEPPPTGSEVQTAGGVGP